MWSECQTTWIQVRHRVTRRLIQIQAVCIWNNSCLGGRRTNIFRDILFNVNSFLCCEHLFDSSRRDESNEWSQHRNSLRNKNISICKTLCKICKKKTYQWCTCTCIFQQQMLLHGICYFQYQLNISKASNVDLQQNAPQETPLLGSTLCKTIRKVYVEIMHLTMFLYMYMPPCLKCCTHVNPFTVDPERTVLVIIKLT